MRSISTSIASLTVSAIALQCLLAPRALAAEGAPATPSRSPSRLETYGQLPLSFEPNRGQAPADARFVAYGAGSRLLVTPSGATLELSRAAGREQAPETVTATLQMRIEGADPAADLEPLDELPGRSAYVVGSNQAA